MKYDPAREYEARVPCDRHGTVWAPVVDRWPDGSPYKVVCPECVAAVRRQLVEHDPHLARDEDALRDLALSVTVTLTLLATPGPGQVRERDAVRAAEENLGRGGQAGDGGSGAPMTYTPGDDDGE